MLTQRHLALIRAALQFFDEELVPSGMEVIRFYLDTPMDPEVTHVEIRMLRTMLGRAELKCGRFNRRTGDLVEVPYQELIATDNPTEVDSQPAVLLLLH